MPQVPPSFSGSGTSTTSILLSWLAASDDAITASDGRQVHLFQLSHAVKEYQEGIEFAVLDNQLSDGFYAQTLIGADTGTRHFTLQMPTLQGASASPLVVGPNLEDVTAEEYLWSLYCEVQVTGTPFAIRSTRNGQYYLARFSDPRLTYNRMLTKLYTTGIELHQVRLDNVSVFDPTLSYNLVEFWDSDTAFATDDWDSNNDTALVKTGDVITVADSQNNHDIKRFNDSANTGYVEAALETTTIYDVIITMKMREATFSNDADIFGNSEDAAYIRGDSATTKFQATFDTTNFRYWKNGIEYDSDDMQAPMNEWGVCHFRNTDGWSFADAFAMGQTDGSGAFAEMDIGDVYLLTKPSLQQIREITAHEIIKFGVGG